MNIDHVERLKDTMNIDKEEYTKSLEERIEKLEKLFEHFCMNQCKEIILTDCSLGDIKLGDNCNITLNSCPVGDMISDIEDAENRVDDLESRTEDILADIDEAEARLYSIKERKDK